MTRPPLIFADHAASLAAAGWEVGPLRGKVPLNIHGLTDFTTDMDMIRRWEREWPWANIGARVPAGLVVLDVDPRHSGDEALARLEQVYGPLPATMTVHSGRGDGGRHIYLRGPSGELSGTRLPNGIDLRTCRNYMVMPPSIHPATGQPYRWEEPVLEPAACPGWLADLLQVSHRQGGVQHHPQGGDRHHHLVDFVGRQPEGNRNHGLYWAACRAAETGVLDTLEADLVDAAVRAGLAPAEAQRTVTSARRCAA